MLRDIRGRFTKDTVLNRIKLICNKIILKIESWFK